MRDHNYVVARDAQTFLGKWKYTLWKQSIPHSPGSLIWYFWCGFRRKKKKNLETATNSHILLKLLFLISWVTGQQFSTKLLKPPLL